MKYNWKDKYYDKNGTDFDALNKTVKFYSSICRGDGSRANPGDSRTINAGDTMSVLSGGNHSIVSLSGNNSGQIYLIGNGTMKDATIGSLSIPTFTGCTFMFLTIKHLQRTINDINAGNYFHYCDIYNYSSAQYTWEIINSIVRFEVLQGTHLNNSYIGIDNKSLYNSNLSLFEKCNINITQANINSYQNLYFAFSDCNLKIGNESDYQPLNGTTEAELRADFVARCTAQGITCPTGTEYGETLQMYRWVFAKSSSVEGVVLADSIIHNFEKRRFIYFGYTSLREGFTVTATTKKNSFGMYYPYKDLLFSDSGMSFPSWIDISTKVEALATSNIMWLGGKKALTKLELIHNFPKEYGVNVDSTPTIGDEMETGKIEADKYYIVRSTNTGKATVYYNNVYYTSSLTERNNIFKGVDGVTAFNNVYGNAQVFEILDEIQYQTIQMRIVNKIPSEIITQDKALDNGYWYLVEHDTDQSNTTDYVTYNGKDYYVGDSFSGSNAPTNFVANGNVHLRRCWFTNFNYDTEAKDKAFWENEQKPEWIEVTPDDMFCLM
ncbi:MAG: hypothetical protein E6767_20355, partial [Dysgonomonas sp.]|nr:hypothetical protein [Dysgonomonas sp.]